MTGGTSRRCSSIRPARLGPIPPRRIPRRAILIPTTPRIDPAVPTTVSGGPVLILTQPFDPTADYVVAELNRRNVPVFRCDPGDFPQRIRLNAHLQNGL